MEDLVVFWKEYEGGGGVNHRDSTLLKGCRLFHHLFCHSSVTFIDPFLTHFSSCCEEKRCLLLAERLSWSCSSRRSKNKHEVVEIIFIPV